MGRAAAAVSDDGVAIYRPLSTLYFESDTPTKLTAPAQPTKPKPKTRGAATTAQQNLPDAATTTTTALNNPNQHTTDPHQPAPLPLPPVDARALKVFRTLFFPPSVTSTPGEVSWPDFLHAMASAGFRAEKLYGSVWHFQPLSSSCLGCVIYLPKLVGKVVGSWTLDLEWMEKAESFWAIRGNDI